MARHFQRGRVAQPYCEAFPCLKLADVIAEWSEGSRICEWTNEHGIVVGHVSLVEVTVESICFDYLFFGAVNVAAAAGREKVRLQPRDQGGLRRKPAFLDPVSGGPVGCIYFVDQHWAGKTSHRLVHIVQRLDEVNKSVILRDQLKRRVRLGRDAFANPTEYRTSRRELADLERMLVSRGVFRLPTRLSYRALPRWLGPAETPKTELSEDDEGYGWNPGQERGFERFYVGRVNLRE